MKMRNLLALLTAVLLLPTQNIPVHAEQKEFQVGVDSWLMQNSPFSLGNYYRLTKDELQRFQTSLACFDACDLRNELHWIQSPVLVIGGEQDRIFGAESAKEIAGQTNGELILYPNAAHAVYDENPDVLKRIRSFLDA